MSGRLHLVLVPGFAGFDALGQIEYYAGVTPLFRRWLKRNAGAQAVLHYFDNLPTAAVVTRAARLRRYLAKRFARGEFLPGDRLALVGHSTGGLDIRWLVRSLGRDPDTIIPVDGGEGTAVPVKTRDLLKLVDRLVFVSVPQLGTNIADWVRAHVIARQAVTLDLRALVQASQLPVLDRIEGLVARGASHLTGLELLRAVQDALAEADARTCEGQASCVADALEAAAQLELWLREIAWDFRAIDDLTASPPAADDQSPAHWSPEDREQEIALWKSLQIQRRSYATLGRRPFVFDSGKPAPEWKLLELWTYPIVTRADALATKTDAAYRTCYRACAGGPFDAPAGAGTPGCLDAKQQERLERLTGGGSIERWDNDGIVNTRSMLWPDGADTALVAGDHLDIIGHYRPERVAGSENAAPPGSAGTGSSGAFAARGRQFHAYDLLHSDSGFDDDSFERVWNDLFDFCWS